MAKSRIWGAETPEPIATKFCMPGAVQNLFMLAKFGGDWLRSFGAARGRILAFSVDLLRRYNTLALPCECAMVLVVDSHQYFSW